MSQGGWILYQKYPPVQAQFSVFNIIIYDMVEIDRQYIKYVWRPKHLDQEHKAYIWGPHVDIKAYLDVLAKCITLKHENLNMTGNCVCTAFAYFEMPLE